MFKLHQNSLNQPRKTLEISVILFKKKKKLSYGFLVDFVRKWYFNNYLQIY